MIKVPDSSELAEFDLADYTVPTLDKYIDRRGYIYILFDYIYPEYIKVGRTANCKKRLFGYNSDKPYPTARMLYVSEMFEDVHEIEKKILNYMYDNTSPTTLTKEWFNREYKDKIIDIVTKAEELEYARTKV